jgi:hypothetical protein
MKIKLAQEKRQGCYSYHPHPTIKGFHSNLENNHLLQTFHQTPGVWTIFVYVNRFSFWTLVLSSTVLFMIMDLHSTHLWNVFFHSLHYHLVNWGHLLIVSIPFLRLIKSVTIWLLSGALLLTLLIFEINCSETILCPISLLMDIL